MDVLVLMGFTEEDISSCIGAYVMSGSDPVKKSVSNFHEFIESSHDVCVLDVELNTLDDLDELYSFVVKEKKSHSHKEALDRLEFHIECNFDTCTEETALVYKYLINNIDKYDKFDMISHVKNGNLYIVKDKHLDNDFNVIYTVNEKVANSIN